MSFRSFDDGGEVLPTSVRSLDEGREAPAEVASLGAWGVVDPASPTCGRGEGSSYSPVGA